MTTRHCPTCNVLLPLSGEPNCDCETPAVAAPVPEQPPMGTHGRSRGYAAGLDRSNEGER